MNTYEGPKADKIQNMFSVVAKNYDRTNTVLSGGIHHLWRKAAVKFTGAKAGDSVLDCATGTGDLAIEFAKTVGKSAKVVGTDFCQPMLDLAPAKAEAAGFEIPFQWADVMDLPMEDNEFDISSISFGIRNVQDPVKGLSELARVTKPGGTVLVIEFGQMQNPVMGPLYGFYSNKILPKLGGMVSGQSDAYQYLQDSSAKFPCRDEFLGMMNSTGLFDQTTLEFKPLTFGVAYMYKGTVQK